MRRRDQCGLPCTSRWGWETLLSERVSCVAGSFKMTERAEQRICIRLCVKLERSSAESIRMIQEAAATGGHLVIGRQLHRDNMLTHASRLVQNFLVKHQITQVTQPLYSPVTSGFSRN